MTTVPWLLSVPAAVGLSFEGAGHGLVQRREGPAALEAVALKVVAAFQEFVAP